MSKSTLSVAAPDPIKDAFEVIDLCAKTFGNFYDFRRHLRNWYLLNSHYDWQASAVGFIDGQMVTHYGVWGYQMRIGRSVVRCGGIGAVATDGEHRKKGLMAQTIPHSIESMRKLGYDLTVLFGVWDFYHRFGYVRAWNETNWFLGRDKLPAELPKVKFATFSATPNDIIARLHNSHNARVTGAAVRPAFTKSHCFFHGTPECYVWPSAKTPVGHVIVMERDGKLICMEATGKADDALAVLKSLAEKKQLRELSFETLPYNSDLAIRIRQLTCRAETQYIRSGGAMVRIIDLKSCLKKMLPELSARVGASHLADYHGSLTLKYPDGSATLEFNKGEVTLGDKTSRDSISAGYALAQLLIGTDDPMEIVEGGKMKLIGDARMLLPVLFPSQRPQLHQCDRY